jgi:hypothetical protein
MVDIIVCSTILAEVTIAAGLSILLTKIALIVSYQKEKSIATLLLSLLTKTKLRITLLLNYVGKKYIM